MPDSLLPAAVRADVIQFHVLTMFPPHNVNRNEDGRPKTCQLGGAMRGRISNQAKKRALRFADKFPRRSSQRLKEGQDAANLLEDVELPFRSTRTREIGVWLFDRLAPVVGDKEAVIAAIKVNQVLGAGNGACKAKKLKNKVIDVEGSADELLRMALDFATGKKANDDDEISEINSDDQQFAKKHYTRQLLRTEQGLVVSGKELERIHLSVTDIVNQRNEGEAKAKLYDWLKEIKKTGILRNADHDLDIALFGRMVAADPTFNVEAACAVSHAFTTHAFAVEGDYFSAGEELNVLEGTGAAITSYAFFGGGVYYQHAVLDRGHLRDTLSAGRTAEETERLTTKAVTAFLDGLLVAQPKGKRNSFASDVGASYVLVTRGADPAMNLGLAYLQPVSLKDGPDPMVASIDRLREARATVADAYGLSNRVCALNAYGPARRGNAPAAGEVWTVEELRRFVLEPAA